MGYESLDLQPACTMLALFAGYMEAGWGGDLKGAETPL